MRVLFERDRRTVLIRLMGGGRHYGELAYFVLGISGLCAQIEFPSDWHERPRGWVRVGLGLIRVAFSFPWWGKLVPDEYQCSGPTYGFTFFEDGLHLHWGKDKGRRDDPSTVLAMPWQWRHRRHEVLSLPESWGYRYVLKSGEEQHRTATIQIESRLWTRPWIPWRRLSRYIEVEFNDEVGERSGSWKGGVLGCSYEMRPGETPLNTLRRMERERTF